MQTILIKNFKGLTLQESRWAEGYAGYTYGMDVWGLARNAAKVSYPGVLQGIFQVSAGGQAASPSAVTELVTDFVRFQSNDYGIGSPAAGSGRIYRRATTWGYVSAITVSSAPIPAAALQVYGTNMYYAQKTVLGQYDNTNGNANFQTLSDGTTSPRKMKVMKGNLYGLDNRYIWKYDGTTFSNQALTLPADWILRDMDIANDFLFITADNGQFSMLIIWDGISPSYKTPIPIYGETNAPNVKAVGGTVYLVGNVFGTIYRYTNGMLEKLMILPFTRAADGSAGLADYGNALAIASSDGASATLEDGMAGVWTLTKENTDSPLSIGLAFVLRGQPTGKTLGGLFFGPAGYIGAQDVTNGTYEIFELQGANANATNVWQSLPIDAGSTEEKMWHGFKLNFESLNASQTVVLKYRLSESGSFTTLKTFTNTSDRSVFTPLGRSSRVLVVRVELTASSSETTRLHSVEIHYTSTQK